MADTLATAPSMQPGPLEPRIHLLDLPEALLIKFLSSAHCSSSTSRSAASTCQALRYAALQGVTDLRADVDESVPALAFAVRSLPALCRVRLLSDYRITPTAAELHALAAITRLHDLDIGLPSANSGQLIARVLAARAEQDWIALAALTGLCRLRLNCCGVNDASVRILSALPHLHTLDLEQSAITGEHALASATALTSLNMSDTLAVGRMSLSSLTRVTALAHLDLRFCGITASSAAELAGLTTLTHLLASCSPNVQVPALAPLTRLRCLVMPNCAAQEDAAAALVRLTALTRLDLVDTDVEEAGMRAVAALTGLASLDMGCSGDEEYINAAALSALTGLTRLSLWRCRLYEEPGTGSVALAGMPRLRTLDLQMCEVGDEGAAAIAGLTALEHLGSLAGMDVGVVAAVTALTALTFLQLREDLRDEGMRTVASLPHLQHLGLFDCWPSAAGVAALTALTTLTCLCAVGKDLEADEGACDAGARALSHFSGLQSLQWISQGLGPQGTAAIAALTGLTKLSLPANVIGIEGARALGALTNLQHLNLGLVQLGPEGGATLATLTSLTQLELHHSGLQGACALTRLIRLCILGVFGCDLGNEERAALATLVRLVDLRL